jgi:plastocyanin
MTRNYIFIFIVFSFFCCVYTENITGNVIVFKKGGKESLKYNSNVVVYLKGLRSEKKLKPVIMSQLDKQFDPRVLVVLPGQIIKMKNNDLVRHNVFSIDPLNTYDLGRFPKGQMREVSYKNEGPHKVYCNIHQDMISDVFVVENEYYALTDPKGNFEIKGVPPGKYTLKAWHIYGGISEKSIIVTKTALKVNFLLVSKVVVKSIENHSNKNGKKYHKFKKRSYDDF